MDKKRVTFLKAHKSNIVRMESNVSKFNNAVMPEIVTNGVKTYTIPDCWK